MRVGIAVSDTAAGMFLGQGILLALLQRERTGVGQWVHTSLLEAMLNKLDFQAARYTMSGEVAGQEGNHHPTLAPMGTFHARDGVINIAASTQKMWDALCEALDAQQLAVDPDYASADLRNRNRHALEGALNAVTQRFSVAELVQRLNPVGVPCGPIYDIGQAFDDPQVRHLRMTRMAKHPTLGEINLLRSPINLSANPHPQHFERAAPDPGQHSAELLREADFSDAEIASLMTQGIVA
jgi:crotonobetainyl-CoA:carnitine CoA-transferase CaiB-like acyl-CoA transferase